jgi:hypothetical protein
MDFLDNGVTNGYSWYPVYGGRQDFVTYGLQGREVTIELDDQHITPASQLPALWQYNWHSLIGYLENALYGIHGSVLKSGSSTPVPAQIFIENHDKDSSQIYSDTLSGRFVRLLSPGSWTLTFTAGGYYDTVRDIIVNPGQKTDIIVYMIPQAKPPDTTNPGVPVIYPNPATTEIKVNIPDALIGRVNMKIFNQAGILILENESQAFKGVDLHIDTRRLNPGIYSIVFTNSQRKTTCKGRFIVIK